MLRQRAKRLACCLLYLPRLPSPTRHYSCLVLGRCPACICVSLITISLLAAVLQKTPAYYYQDYCNTATNPAFSIGSIDHRTKCRRRKKGGWEGVSETRDKATAKRTSKKDWQRPTFSLRSWAPMAKPHLLGVHIIAQRNAGACVHHRRRFGRASD